MIRYFCLFVILLSSCADLPYRQPAALSPPIFGEVDPQKSIVRSFPKDRDPEVGQSFYLEMKDQSGQFVDVRQSEISVSSKRSAFNQSVLRLGSGRYEVVISDEDIDVQSLRFFVQKKQLKHSLVPLARASRKNSHLRIISASAYELVLELSLKDRSGHYFEPAFSPELLVEGDALVTEVLRKKKGIWHFRLTFPEDNQILYFSVRANGVNLSRLLRFQHVEK
jgi:hypothetical protein